MKLLTKLCCLFSFKTLLSLTLASSMSVEVFAAACCAGGGTASPLITEQNKIELRLNVSHSSVVAEKFDTEKPLFWDTERSQLTTTVSPSIGYAIAQDWQVGGSFDYVMKDYTFEQGESESSGRLGDVQLLVAYELIHPSPPHQWSPQLFISYEHLFPTGRGLEESGKPGLSDVSGSDQTLSSIGVHLFKRLYRVRLSSEIRYSRAHPAHVEDVKLLARQQVQASVGAFRLQPRSSWSYGLNVAAHYQEGRHRETSLGKNKAPTESFYEVIPYFVWSPRERMSLTLSYADQTIFGPVQNTTLSRRVALLLSHEITK